MTEIPLKDGQPVPCTLVNGIYVPHDHDPKRDAEMAKMAAGMGRQVASFVEFAGGNLQPIPKPRNNFHELNREVEEHRAIAARRVRRMGYKP